MVKNELLESSGHNYLATLKGQDAETSYLVGFIDGSAEVFSYESTPKQLSTCKSSKFPKDNMRFFFDYDKELGVLPFAELSYSDCERENNYKPKFKICKVKNDKTILESTEVSTDTLQYVDNWGDSLYYRVSPTMFLLSHNRNELISFEYTTNPYTLKCTATSIPLESIDKIFKTDDKDVSCCFGFNNSDYTRNPDKASETPIFTFNAYLFFFFNTKEKKVCQHQRFNCNDDSVISFGISNAYVNAIIQDPEDNYSFKIVSHGKVYRIRLSDLVERNKLVKKIKFGAGTSEERWEYLLREVPKLNGQEILNTNNLPTRRIDTTGIQPIIDNYPRRREYTVLKITDYKYVLVLSHAEFYYFNVETNEFVKCNIKREKKLDFFVIEEVYRNESEVNFLAYTNGKDVVDYILKINIEDVVNGCEVIYRDG